MVPEAALNDGTDGLYVTLSEEDIPLKTNRHSFGFRASWVLLLSLIFVSFLFAQLEDLEELGEEVKCRPDTIVTGYEKFKADSITAQQVAIWYSLGQEEYKYKNFKRAIPYFWRVLMNDQSGKFKVVYSKLADCYFNLNFTDSTLLVAYLGLEKYPDHPRLNFWAGFIHDRLGHIKCAIPHYEVLVKLFPTNKEYWAKLAFLYFKAEDPRAIEAQQKVVELDPKNSEATLLLAEIMNHFGEDPIKALRQSFQNDTTNLDNAFRYGKAAFDRGLYEDALRPFRTILRKEPNNTRVMEYMGRTYEALNRMRDAIEMYKMILKIEPKNTKVMCLIASVYSQLNEFSTARFWANKAKRIDPGYGLPYMVMAEVYENAVTYCSDRREKKQFTYDDKLVYRLASEEYQKAARDPNYAADASRRIKQLETLLPTKEDLFMQKNRLTPRDPCYSWITQ